jgi:hypothetical protein
MACPLSWAAGLELCGERPHEVREGPSALGRRDVAAADAEKLDGEFAVLG